MAREVLSNGVINPDKYQADWYADLSNNWNLLNNLIGSAISSSEVDSKIATAIQELMVRTFQIVAELPVTGTEGVMYLVSIPNTSKYTAYVWENNAYRELGVIQMTITIDDELSTTSENPAQNKVITNALNNKAPISHTHSASDITSGLATVATSGSYNDLSNKPTIPTVNNATLTIQRNGTTVDTFTANASVDKTININTADDTKIPLAGSNAISGSLIPATTNAYDLGGSSYQWNNAYIKSLTINGVACGDILTHNVSEFVPRSGGAVLGGMEFRRTTNNEWLSLHSSSDGNGSYMTLESGGSPDAGIFAIHARTTPSDDKILRGSYTGTLTWGSKNVAMQEDVVPRSGGAVMTGNVLARTVNNSYLRLCGGMDESGGAYFQLSGNNASYSAQHARLVTGGKTIYYFENTNFAPGFASGGTRPSLGAPNYEWGQIYSTNSTIATSDARFKNSVKDIDDRLLNAWGNIEPKQYKFNDATEQKGEKARFHTGYLAQDIQAECEKQGVNASDYGLFCYDEWEEQEEVSEEIETEKDGEIIKEKHVIQPRREKGDMYALRYEEALVVECAYLRKKLKELTVRIEQLEKGNKEVEK